MLREILPFRIVALLLPSYDMVFRHDHLRGQ